MHLIILDNPIIIQTHRGRTLPVLRIPPSTNRMRREIERRLFSSFPDVVERRGSTETYNCYGLAFAMRRAWLDMKSVELVLEDDGYRMLRNQEDVMPGDLVLYRAQGEVIHVGWVLRLDKAGGVVVPYIVSKWGEGPEYLHTVGRTPYREAAIEYWTERP